MIPKSLKHPISAFLVNFVSLVAGLKQIYKPHQRYKKAGVTLYDFIDPESYQSSLFTEMNPNPRHGKLMEALDKINLKSKTGVRLASQDAWMIKMHREYLSKEYTTDINQLIEVRI